MLRSLGRRLGFAWWTFQGWASLIGGTLIFLLQFKNLGGFAVVLTFGESPWPWSVRVAATEFTESTEMTAKKIIALTSTFAVCAFFELLIILLLGYLSGSYWGAAGISLVIFGPVSLWMAPIIYNRIIKA